MCTWHARAAESLEDTAHLASTASSEEAIAQQDAHGHGCQSSFNSTGQGKETIAMVMIIGSKRHSSW